MQINRAKFILPAILLSFGLQAAERSDLPFDTCSEIDEFISMVGVDDMVEELSLANNIIDYAYSFMGRPYRHGSKGPKSFDCSGFTSYIFKEFDKSLNASASTQFLQGTAVDKEDIRPGDLLFFSRRKAGKTVGHVAIAVSVDDNGKITFIHAARHGGIRLDKYPDSGYYTTRFIGARRVI